MDKQKKVTVFSTQSCQYCIMLKRYFDDKKVAYKNIDVSEDAEAAQEMFMKSHQMGVPQLWVDDDVVVGFDLERINQLLAIK